MRAAVQMIDFPLDLLPSVKRRAAQKGDLLEFARKEPKLASGEEAAKFEENNLLRQKVFDLQRDLEQKDALLKNARIREMELRSHVANLMC